jgi:hypothetical protein
MAQPGNPKTDTAGTTHSPFRVLVVAAEEHIEEPLERELAKRASDREVEVKVVVPALTDTRFQHAAGAVDEPLERARGELERSLDQAREAGVEAEGQVGDSDPMLAIDDALFDFPADEIILVTHDAEGSRWLEDDIFDRAKSQFEPPITRWVAGSNGAHREGQTGPGIAAPEKDQAPDSSNLPPLARRDIAGLAFALLGTLALFLIAASEPDTSRGDFDFNAVHMLLAGVFGLINIAHVVGLVLFSSVGYRGAVRNFFARLSLYGTAAAIALSAILLLVD